MVGWRVCIIVEISLTDMFNKRNMSIYHVYIRSVSHSNIKCPYFNFKHVEVYNEAHILFFTSKGSQNLRCNLIFKLLLRNKEKNKQ